MAHFFVCSLGSNIEPEYNVSRAKSYLAGVGQALYYSRTITTEPVDMASEHSFLNALFVISTHLDAKRLKQAFNTIEISLGRDRSDPDCSIKDRTIDIDILGEIDNISTPLASWPAVPKYLKSLQLELQQSLLERQTAITANQES